MGQSRKAFSDAELRVRILLPPVLSLYRSASGPPHPAFFSEAPIACEDRAIVLDGRSVRTAIYQAKGDGHATPTIGPPRLANYLENNLRASGDGLCRVETFFSTAVCREVRLLQRAHQVPCKAGRMVTQLCEPKPAIPNCRLRQPGDCRRSRPLSAIWSNSENICSFRVLLALTHLRHSVERYPTRAALLPSPQGGPPRSSRRQGHAIAKARPDSQVEASGERAKLDVDRRRRINERAESEPSVRRVDAEDGDVVGLLLDLEDCDAVVPTVRGVEKSPARMDANLSGGVGTGEVGRQCRNCLMPDERSTHRIIVEDGDRGDQLRQDVSVLPIGVEGHVPWSGTGRDPRERYCVGVEGACAWIEVPHIELVSAEVDAEH